MSKDNLNTMIAYPQKPIIAETTVTNTTTTPINMAEVERLREENKRLQEKVEKYLLKECMRRVESLRSGVNKMSIKLYLDEHNPIMLLIECFRYANGEKVKELYDTYGFDMIIKAIRSLFTEDDKEEEDE